MKIDLSSYIRDLRNIVGFFVISAMTQHEKTHGKQGWYPEDGIDSKAFDVEVRICGVEVDFVAVLRRFEEQLDRMIEEAAAKLLRERCGEMLDGLHQLSRDVDQAARRLFPLSDRGDD